MMGIGVLCDDWAGFATGLGFNAREAYKVRRTRSKQAPPELYGLSQRVSRRMWDASHPWNGRLVLWEK